MTTATPHPQRAALVLVVGVESSRRRRVSNALVERGYAVVACSGPPGCPLLDQDRCALVEAVDVAVVMGGHSARRDVAPALARCAAAAAAAVLVEPSAVVPVPANASVVRGEDAVADAVDRSIRIGVRRRRRVAVADVADIWL